MRTRDAIRDAKDALGFSAKSPNQIDRDVDPELRQMFRALKEIDKSADEEYEQRALADGALTQCRRAREYLVCFGGSWELEALLLELERFCIRRSHGIREDVPVGRKAA